METNESRPASGFNRDNTMKLSMATVLIVDDDEDVLTAAKLLLKQVPCILAPVSSEQFFA